MVVELEWNQTGALRLFQPTRARGFHAVCPKLDYLEESAVARAMDFGTSKTAVFHNINIAYYSFGIGPEALVFVHGWSCKSLLWGGQEGIILQHRSILIDLPGHGKSDAPVLQYSQELFAHSVKAVLDTEGITKSVLIGHSLGGPISTMVLRLYPHCVAGIVYVDSFFSYPESYLSGVTRRKLAETLRDDKAFDAKLDHFWTNKTTTEVQVKVRNVMLGTRKHVRINALTSDSLPHAWRWEEIYNIPVTLVATPNQARIDPHWLHHMPNLKITTWDGNGHFLFMEEPERFNREVEAFLVENKLLED